jgi:hypothetical protein
MKEVRVELFERDWYRRIIRGLGRIFFRDPGPTTTPSIVCEKCHHRQSPQTTNNAVLASLVNLNAYLLAICNDLEEQYWTIRSQGVNVVATLLIIGTVLGFIGAGCLTILFFLPYILGIWDLWWCFWGTVERIVNSFDEREDYVHVQVQNEGEEESDGHLGEIKEHID